MTREERLALAGAYVLGHLEGAELERFEMQRAGDPELANAVDRLQRHMLALDDTATPEAIPAGLWSRIEAGIEVPAKSADIVPLKSRRAPVLSPWMSIAATALVAAVIGFWSATMTVRPPEPIVIAVLMNEAGAVPGAIVEAYADDTVLLRLLETVTVPEGQVLQVWTLPDADTGPVSLGVLGDAQRLRLSGPDLPVPHDGQLYEITVEPSPGSPTGRPTGPILVKGFAKPAI